MGTVYRGGRSAAGMKFGIAAGAFNELIVEKLVAGAIELIAASGGDRDAIDVAWCPGAVELPLVAKKLADSGRYDAVIGIGCVIRGGTPHFDYVSAQASNGLARVQLDAGMPVRNGLLSTIAAGVSLGSGRQASMTFSRRFAGVSGLRCASREYEPSRF